MRVNTYMSEMDICFINCILLFSCISLLPIATYVLESFQGQDDAHNAYRIDSDQEMKLHNVHTCAFLLVCISRASVDRLCYIGLLLTGKYGSKMVNVMCVDLNRKSPVTSPFFSLACNLMNGALMYIVWSYKPPLMLF